MNRAEKIKAGGDESLRRWNLTPSVLVGYPPEIVRKTVLGELYALRQLFSPTAGVKL